MIKQTILKDSFNDFTNFIDDSSGFLHINGVVARTGIQPYMGAELGNMEEPTKLFNVYRPREEVIKEESLNTYINAPVTDDHPNDFVTVDNATDLIKGSVATVETINKDGIDYIKAKLVITDKELINKVVNGKVEISAGYSQNLVKEKGEFEGVTYDYKQTDIKINHIAIVDSARCGDACKIVFDNNYIIVDENITKGKTMVIKIGDSDFDIADSVAEYIKSLETKYKDACEETIKKDEDMEKLKAEKEEEIEDVKKSTDSKIDALLTAKELGLKVSSADSITAIKKAIIATKSDMALDGVCDAGIDTAYNMVKSQIAKDSLKKEEIEKSQTNAFDGLKHSDNKSFADLKDKEY